MTTKKVKVKAQLIKPEDVKTEVNMRLTKDDLIDMIVSEEEERLQTERDELSKKFRNIKNKISDDEREKIVKEVFKVVFPQALTQAKKYSKVNYFLDNLNWAISSDYDMEFCIQFDMKTKIEYGAPIDDDLLKKSKTLQKLVDRKKEGKELEVKIASLDRQIGDLGRMGKRAKAKMVRSMLEATESGQQILATMNGASKLLKGKVGK